MLKAMIVFGCVMSMLSGIFYVLLGRKGGSARALAMKAAASIFFFLTGLVCAFGYRPLSLFDILVLSGLFFGMVADAVFGARFTAKKKPARFFVAGALLFAVGHGFYIAAFNCLRPVTPVWYAAAAVTGAFVFFAGKYIFRMHYGRLWPMILLYCAVVCVMLFSAIAAGDVFRPGRQLFIAAAAFLFAFSDMVLLYATFVKSRTRLHFLSICPYYAGQLLFAVSLTIL